MNNIKNIPGFAFLLFTSTAQANLFSFDGALSIFDTTDTLVFSIPAYTGQIEYDTATQVGSASFDPVIFKASDFIIHDVVLTQIGGTLHADGFWDWSININQAISWDWSLTALPGGVTSLTLIDTDNDGVPGTALVGGPLPGFTFAIEGTTSPVPLPASLWLFGSGLLGLLGFTRYRRKS